ncbi:hypothetical protein MDA_GLEAN10001619 [Myotis davidii]|uniref:Uncharacterized protein n=1 Tax=Myotis davidii TaxID=225400 RepID=L5LJZ8_MYODS|nr:hypothetical protein MDA_GLEAN10001619 [Myotis davidii]
MEESVGPEAGVDLERDAELKHREEGNGLVHYVSRRAYHSQPEAGGGQGIPPSLQLPRTQLTVAPSHGWQAGALREHGGQCKLVHGTL